MATNQQTINYLAQLKKMRGKAGEMLFKRVKMAVACYADEDWIVEAFAGNYKRAEDYLNLEFPELLKSRSFKELRTVYLFEPTLLGWKAAGFNVSAMLADAMKHNKPTRVSHWSCKKSEWDDLVEELRLAHQRIEELEQKLISAQAEVKVLEQKLESKRLAESGVLA